MKIRTKTIAIALAASLSAAASAAESDEAALEIKLRELYPATQFSGVHKTEIPELFEVGMGRNIGYTNSEGRYFLFGHVFDMKTQKDLTAARLEELNAVDFSSLPLKDAIKTVSGNGKRVFAVFSDPDCPYCKKLEPELAKLDNVTVYTFLLPLEGLHPDAKRKATHIWCAKDRVRAWNDFMAKGDLPAMKGKECENPIERNMQLGQKLNINGTPTLIAADGRILPGAAPIEQIEKWLDGGRPAAAAAVTRGVN